MSGTFIILIILFSYLQKLLRTKIELPKWHTAFRYGLIFSIALLCVEVIFPKTRPALLWVGQVMIFVVLFKGITDVQLKNAKPLMFAILPLAIVDAIDDILQQVLPAWHKEIDNIFGIAGIFSFIWMVAMLIINSKQRKALEKERLKALEKEKEFQLSEKMKAALAIQVEERTAELNEQKNDLLHALDELRTTQAQLIQSEKMASLGELTAGIAHEIQNPLNFVNNFSEISNELLTEMVDEINKGNTDEAKDIVKDVQQNLEKILHHGKRADSIVKGMLQHSRSNNNAKKEPTNINALADEYLRLAYHGLRAKDKSFNATLKTDFDASIGNINIIPQDIGRVILNLLTNAFYVTQQKAESKNQPALQQYEPTVSVSTKTVGDMIEIKVADNGNGIPQNLIDKIFQPFFTTKPTGKGTGLGLSLSYDIVKAHNGNLSVDTKENIGTTFTITLPK